MGTSITLPQDVVCELLDTLHTLKRVFSPRDPATGRARGFAGPWWQQPGGVYVNVDDAVVLTLRTFDTSGATYGAAVRILQDDGRVISSYLQMPPGYNNSGSPNTVTLPCWEGLLVSAAVTTSNAGLPAGTSYVTLTLERNAGPDQHFQSNLASGYLSGPQPVLGWPPVTQQQSTEGRGTRALVKLGAQSAGAEIVYGIPNFQTLRPCTVSVTLVTSATVANRVPVLQFSDGTTVFWQEPNRVSTATAQPASTTWTYEYGMLLGYEQTAVYALGANSAVTISLPDIMLGPFWQIRTQTTGLQPGDVWTSFVMCAESWATY